MRRTIFYAKKHKTGGELNYGDKFNVCEKGEEGGLVWLCLADGRGWAIERTNRRRCSEVVYEELPDYQRDRQLMVAPSLGHPLELRHQPYVASGATQNVLIPGQEVRIRQRANVIVQAKGGKGEISRIFLKVYTEGNVEGWIPELLTIPNGRSSLVDAQFEALDPNSPAWISVVEKSGAPVYPYPGRSPVDKGQKIGVGDICPVLELCTVDNLRFYRLADGGWICETAPNNSRAFEIVTREEHWWQYSTIDKDGAAIRHAPTRSHAMDTGKKLKHRQRVVTSEIVKFPNGDSFVHVEPPNDGWVPVMKVGGDPKMKPLSPVNPQQRSHGKGGKPPLGHSSFQHPGPKGGGKGKPPGPMPGGPPMSAPGFAPGPGYGAPPPGYGGQPQGPGPMPFGATSSAPAGAFAGMRPRPPVPGGDFGVGSAGSCSPGDFAARGSVPASPGGFGISNPQAGQPPNSQPQAKGNHRGSDFGI